MIICFAWACASRKYQRSWLIYQYFSAPAQFIPNFSKLKLQTSVSSKIVSLSKIIIFPTSVFCQCMKLNLHWTNSRQYFFLPFQTTQHSLASVSLSANMAASYMLIGNGVFVRSCHTGLIFPQKIKRVRSNKGASWFFI